MTIGGRQVVAVLLACLLLGGGATLWLRYSGGTQRVGLLGGGLDDWLGRQIVAIVNTFLHPQIEFDTLDYDAPGTVTLTGARFVAPDGTDVFDVDTLTIELAETPGIGKPIVIRRLIIDGGTVNLLQNEAGDGFRGLNPLVRSRKQPQPEQDQAEQRALSEILQLREVRIRNGALALQTGDGPPMVLRDLMLALDIREATADDGAAEPGWYALELDTGRPPNAVINAAARLNLDTLTLDLERADFALTVTEATVESLPSQLQNLLRTHEAHGEMKLSFAGLLPLRDVAGGAEAEASIALRDFNFTSGELRLPIDRLDIEAEIRDGSTNIASGLARMLGGTLAFRGAVPFDPDAAAQFDWTAARLELEQLLATRPEPRPDDEQAGDGEREPPKLAGRLSGEGVVRFTSGTLPDSLEGDGAIEINEGRLLMIPGLTQLANFMKVGSRLYGDYTRNHRASARFTVQPEAVRIDESQVVTTALAARSVGTLGYDGNMDLSVNAGPLERLQASLGLAGDIFANISDRLVTYRIRGPMGSPSVSVMAGRSDDKKPARNQEDPR